MTKLKRRTQFVWKTAKAVT